MKPDPTITVPFNEAMRTIARLVLGITIGTPAGILAGCVMGAIGGVVLFASRIVQSANGVLEAVGGMIVAGILFAVILIPTTIVPSVFGGMLSVFPKSRIGVLTFMATLIGMIIGLLPLCEYLTVMGNARPDPLEI